MRQSTKRVLSILTAGLFLLGVLFVYTSLIRPQLVEVESLRSLVTSKEALFESQKKAVSDVQNLLQQFQGIASVEQSVTRALPLSEDVTFALYEYQGLVRTNGISVTSFVVRPLAFSTAKQPIVKRLGTLEVDSAVEGSYDGVKNFIRGLEISSRLMNVKQITITRVDDEGARGDVFSARILLEMFYQES